MQKNAVLWHTYSLWPSRMMFTMSDEQHDVRQPDIQWYGYTTSHSLNAEYLEFNTLLANAAKRYDWPEVLALLDKNPDTVNTWRLGGKSHYTALHQAAHGGADEDVIHQLLARGAWRTLQTTYGERPVDVAMRKGHPKMARLLEPVLLHCVPNGILLILQHHLHGVIQGRVGELVKELDLRLPELEPLLELATPRYWCPVPGMCGGFHIKMVKDGVAAELDVESWCRGALGSGQRHKITPRGAVLIDEGFV